MADLNLTSLSRGMQYQMKIYIEGAQNKKPSVPVSYDNLEAKAKEKMAPEAFAYIAGGAGGETTMYNNKTAFNKWQIVPRMMGDVSKRDIGVDLFGTRFPTPVFLGPIGVLSIAHKDAKMAIARGMDGIIVSNHGGRQCDGSVGALDMLGEIADAVGTKTTILFDSGIRRGADVLKAMALGAKAVLIGRPYAYGLALAGEEGVKEVISNLLADVDLTLGLVGCTSWKDVSGELLRKVF